MLREPRQLLYGHALVQSEVLETVPTSSSQTWYFRASSLACWSPSSFLLSFRLLL